MSLTDHFLSLAPRIAWGLAGFVAVSFLTTLLSLGAPKHKDGWMVMRPTYLLYLIAAISLAASPFFAVVGSAGLVTAPSTDFPHPRLIAIGELFLAAVFPYCATATFCSSARFNDEGVAKSWFGRWRFHPWSDIKRLKRSFLTGPVLVTVAGRKIGVSDYRVGFSHLVQMAHANGVMIEEEFKSA